MKILFILSRIEKNGVTTHTLDLAKGLIRQGHQLEMITGGIFGGVTNEHFEFLNKIQGEFEDLGVNIKTFAISNGNILSKLFSSIISMFQILRWIAKSDVDVIHCQSPNTTFLPWLLRKKFITTVHSDLLRKNIMYKNPTKLIAVSKESKQYGIEILGAKSEDTPIVLHGISERFSQETPEKEIDAIFSKYKLPKDKIIIGFVGRITPVKGLDIFIKAVDKNLPKDLQDKIHLVFLGDYFLDSDEKWLTNLIQSSSLSEKITLIPFQDPKPFYQLFDIFVLPSRSDTFGLVAVEAMMSGCCTIRSDSFGAYDQIINGADGFIYNMENASALGEILNNLIQDESLRKSIAKKGKQKALDNFTIKMMTTNTVKVYQSIVTDTKHA